MHLILTVSSWERMVVVVVVVVFNHILPLISAYMSTLWIHFIFSQAVCLYIKRNLYPHHQLKTATTTKLQRIKTVPQMNKSSTVPTTNDASKASAFSHQIKNGQDQRNFLCWLKVAGTMKFFLNEKYMMHFDTKEANSYKATSDVLVCNMQVSCVLT